MGMEALETAVAYWEDALEAYHPPGGKKNKAITTREESRSQLKLPFFMNSSCRIH